MNDTEKHPLDSRILKCVRCGFCETELSARLRRFDHPDARKGFEVKHCPGCGGDTKILLKIAAALGGEP
jgi:hypothetical protein